MLKSKIERLSQKIEDIEEKFENEDLEVDEQEKLELEVPDLEREISELYDYADSNPNTEFEELDKIEELRKSLNRIKKENGFYDEDSMLDMMFPNRGDDDFDEDSMSYDSVFGDD